MSKYYSTCVVGLGKIGSSYPTGKIVRTHTEAYIKNKKTTIVAGVDPNKNARNDFLEKWKLDIPVFPSVKEMLDKIKPDVVSICVPTEKLVDVLDDFKKKPPKIFFLEKPLFNNINDGKIILEKINKIPTAVNYHRCWDPSHSNFFKKISQSGKLKYIKVIYNNGMFNYASHLIALLICHFGNVKEIKRSGTKIHNLRSKDPSYSFILEFTCGIQAFFQGFDDIHYDLLETQILTSSGIFSLKSAGCRKRIEIPKRNAFYQNYKQLTDYNYNEKDGQIDGLTQAIENIVSFLDGKNKKIICNIKTSFQVAKIMCNVKIIANNTKLKKINVL